MHIMTSLERQQKIHFITFPFKQSISRFFQMKLQQTKGKPASCDVLALCAMYEVFCSHLQFMR